MFDTIHIAINFEHFLCMEKKEKREREREFAFAVVLVINFVCKTLKHFEIV